MLREIAPIPVSDLTIKLPACKSDRRMPANLKLINLAGIIIPFLGVISVPLFLWGWGFSWIDLGLLAGMYFATALGITVGFHRLFTHKSFETHVAVEFILAVLGSMAVQGPLFKWVAVHRRHHQHSDQPEDPHSPLHHGPGVWGVVRGMWHAHIGWLFLPDSRTLGTYVKDLKKRRALRIASSLFPVWVALGMAIPTVVGGVLTGSWLGAATGFLWGGLIRVFLVHHVTWSINSACHLWGQRPFQSDDASRDNAVFGYLALGEGWHNTHHAFPISARHGLRWWQLDVTYWIIRALELFGAAWNVKIPSKAAQAQKRRLA
jgi:stearoyl-CoA desaturase (delta-9 desaturase)